MRFPFLTRCSSQRLCKRLLETQGGLDVITADDGDTALITLIDSYAPGGSAFDFVLMDLMMPRKDGVTATREFRAWEREHLPAGHHLTVIALSANVFEDVVATCTAAGFDAFVCKPLRLDTLRVALAANNM